MNTKTTEFESPLTKTKYTIFEVSPYLLKLINEDTIETPESTKIRMQIADVLKSLANDKEALDRADLTGDLRQEIQARVDTSMRELKDAEIKLRALVRVKPATMCATIRTFVKGFENMSDLEIMRAGKDIDLLYMKVQTLSEDRAAEYASALELFRSPQRGSDKPSSQGQSVQSTA